jgi:RNA polymerase sigma-70 factor (ECF subfamily)
MSGFLASVEKRAFKQSVFAVRNDEAALDIVQDAMLKLAEKYSAKSAAELPMLFHRILQNTIKDYFRRQKVRSNWISLFSAFGSQDDDDSDLLETLVSEDTSSIPASPAAQFEQAQILEIIQEAIEGLPMRQRQAFMLRYWEEFDVNETALAMGCSEGSVKTHCSRAVHALALSLKAKGITL